MTKIRVLVVDDSLTMRKALIEILSSDAGIEVVGEAVDGAKAIELCQKLKPDVVTLDMVMPKTNGLEATEYLMAYSPVPILVVSSSTNRADLFKTYDALAAGAVDVLEKPRAEGADETWSRKFIDAVKLVSRIRVVTHPRVKLRHLRTACAQTVKETAQQGLWQGPSCILIGASTGGPSVLVSILQQLPTDFSLPIVIVIHIGGVFAASFAEWLDKNSALRVHYAEQDQLLPTAGEGKVFLAPPDRHLRIKNRRFILSDDPERFSCRPSIDVLFESAAEELGGNCAAFLLTGMGRDGAAGLLAIRMKGGYTAAQDEKSCVVFGMPKEAIAMGAAQAVLSTHDILGALLKLDGDCKATLRNES